MSMAVARARHLKPLATGQLPVTASALIIGGGLAGMTAALGIADQGFDVHLVERTPPWAAICALSTPRSSGPMCSFTWPAWWPRWSRTRKSICT